MGEETRQSAKKVGFVAQEGLDLEIVHAKINAKGLSPGALLVEKYGYELAQRYFSCSCDDHFCPAYRRSMKPLRSSSESGPGSMNSAGLR